MYSLYKLVVICEWRVKIPSRFLPFRFALRGRNWESKTCASSFSMIWSTETTVGDSDGSFLQHLVHCWTASSWTSCMFLQLDQFPPPPPTCTTCTARAGDIFTRSSYTMKACCNCIHYLTSTSRTMRRDHSQILKQLHNPHHNNTLAVSLTVTSKNAQVW